MSIIRIVGGAAKTLLLLGIVDMVIDEMVPDLASWAGTKLADMVWRGH